MSNVYRNPRCDHGVLLVDYCEGCEGGEEPLELGNNVTPTEQGNDELDKVLNLVVWGDYQHEGGTWGRGIQNRPTIVAAMEGMIIRAKIDLLQRLRAKADFMEAGGLKLDIRATVWNELEMLGAHQINDEYEAAKEKDGS